MAEVIWTEPALNDLNAIADYIALDNPEAARRLVQKIFAMWGNRPITPGTVQSHRS
jgi:plasmid stabilization system protein ParE